LFVHVSAFPRDGSRPTAGESLTYEIGRGKDGKPQAVQVYRSAIGHTTDRPAHPTMATRNRRSPQPALAGNRRSLRPALGANRRPALPMLVGIVLLVGLGAFGYDRYARQVMLRQPDAVSVREGSRPNPDSAPVRFQCDGRIHCSQMTSCAEAKFFLANCPGTEMDGNHDGVPCERQWCTGPSAR
jgi:hypothetical protein